MEKVIRFRCSDEMAKKVDELAESYKLTKSDFIRYLICTAPDLLSGTIIQVAKKDLDIFIPFCTVLDFCTAYDLTKHYPDDEFRFHLIDDSLGERVYFIKNGKHI